MYDAFAAAPETPLPFSTVSDTFEGGSVFVFTLLPSAAAFAAFGVSTSGVSNWLTAFWTSVVEAVQAPADGHCTFATLSWNTWPGGSPAANSAYWITWLPPSDRPPSPTSMFFVIVLTRDGSSVNEKFFATCTRNALMNSCCRATRTRSESV